MNVWLWWSVVHSITYLREYSNSRILFSAYAVPSGMWRLRFCKLSRHIPSGILGPLHFTFSVHSTFGNVEIMILRITILHMPSGMLKLSHFIFSVHSTFGNVEITILQAIILHIRQKSRGFEFVLNIPSGMLWFCSYEFRHVICIHFFDTTLCTLCK